MPDRRRCNCKICGGHYTQVGMISWRGKCVPCAKRRVEENLDALMTHSGPALERWRRSVALSVGAVLVDDVLAVGDHPPT